MQADELITEGRAALRRGDGAAARRAFEDARAETNGGAVLEGLAQAAYLEFFAPENIGRIMEATGVGAPA